MIHFIYIAYRNPTDIMRYVILLLLIIPIPVFAQWTIVPTATTSTLECVDYLNGNYFFIGRASSLRTTTDGGATWASPQIRDLSNTVITGSTALALHFFSPTTGICTGAILTGNSRCMLRTVNSANNWAFAYTSNSGSPPRVQNSMCFPSASVGYSVGTGGTILKTTDGGVSWNAQTSGTTVELYCVYFTDIDTGYVSGNGRILRTVNGGATWLSTTVTGQIKATWFSSPSTGFAAGINGGTGMFYRTTDYGVTWNASVNPFNTDVNSLEGRHSDSLYVASGNRMYFSTSGGSYWNYFPSTVGYTLNDIDFIPNTDSAIAVGNNGICLRTADGGGSVYAPVSLCGPAAGTTVCQTNSLSFNNYGDPAWSFQWLVDNVLNTTTYNATIMFPTTGIHTVRLVAYNGQYYDTASTINVTVNPLPNVNPFTTVRGANPVCPGASSTIQVLNSQVGVSYQLRTGITQIGAAQNGNNGTLTFNTGAIATTTAFYVYGTQTNSCGNANFTHANDTIFTNPVNQTLTVTSAADSVCNGSGTNILLLNSIAGNTYRLRIGTTVVGSPQTGNGGTLSFPTGNLSANTTFNIYCTNTSNCSAAMTQTKLITVITVSTTIAQSPGAVVGDTLHLTHTSAATNFFWNFGPNASPATSTLSQPGVVFSTMGLHDIVLQASASPGCIAIDTMTVMASATASTGPGALCMDTSYQYRYGWTYFGYEIVDFCLDPAGNSYAVGYYDSTMGWGMSYNMIIMKFDPSGTLLWRHKQVAQSYGYNDYRSSFGTSVKVDSSGNIYVGGCFAATFIQIGTMTISGASQVSSEKAFMIKFDPNGNPLWHVIANAPSQGAAVTDIAIENNNSVYFVIGGPQGPQNILFPNGQNMFFSPDRYPVIHVNGNGIFINRSPDIIDPSGGNPLLQTVCNPSNSFYNTNSIYFTSPKLALKGDSLLMFGMTVAPIQFGTIVFTPSGNTTGLVAALNTNTNNWVGVQQLFYTSTSYNSHPRPTVSMKPNGGWFFAWSSDIPTIVTTTIGSTQVTGMNTSFVASYNANGTVQWVDANVYRTQVTSLAAMSNSQVVAFGRSGNGFDSVHFLHIPSPAGQSYGFPIRYVDSYLASYSSAGNVDWVQPVRGGGRDEPFFVQKLNCEQVYLIGQSDSFTLFNGDTITFTQNNIYLAKFSITGNCGPPFCPPPLIMSAQSVPAICSGNCATLGVTVSGGAGPYTYNWMPGNLNGASPSVCPTVTTSYTCTVTDSVGAISTTTVLVTVNSIPNVQISGPTSVCIGNSVTLTSTGAQTYIWNPGPVAGSSIIVSPTSTVTYTVQGTSAQGCTATATTTVVVSSLPLVTATATIDTVCSGGSVTISAGGANTYVWMPGNLNGSSINPTINATVTYTVTGTDLNNCSATATQLVVANALPAVTLNLNPIDTLCLSSGSVPLMGESPAGGTWSGTAVTGSSFDPLAAGVGMHTITYTYADVNGCSAIAVDSIWVDLCSGIDEAQNAIIALCPNPTNGEFTLQLGGTGSLNITIVDAIGQVVVSEQKTSGTHRFSLPAPGVYLIVVSDENSNRWTRTVIVE